MGYGGHISPLHSRCLAGVSVLDGWVSCRLKGESPASSTRNGADSRWQVGTALYILGLISYQGALTCTYSGHNTSVRADTAVWTAAFPGLARDLPEVKASEISLQQGEIE